MPAVGFASVVSDHTSMGTGALIPFNVLPAALLTNSPYPTLNGPNLALVRLRPGVSPAAGLANLQRMADAANRDFAEVPDGDGVGNTVVVQGVQRPAEIVNYRTVGAVPALLVARTCPGRGGRLGAHLGHVGPKTTSRPRPVEDAGLHPAPAGRRRGVASVRLGSWWAS